LDIAVKKSMHDFLATIWANPATPKVQDLHCQIYMAEKAAENKKDAVTSEIWSSIVP
jgi:hypothetical protein